jgi:hypothetical protein
MALFAHWAEENLFALAYAMKDREHMAGAKIIRSGAKVVGNLFVFSICLFHLPTLTLHQYACREMFILYVLVK